MRNLTVVFCVTIAFCALLLAGPSAVWSENPDKRAPFALQLPDIDSSLITAPEVRIPTADLRRLRILVRTPFADDIPYDKLHTFINGEAAGTIATVTAGRNGKVVMCDLESKPRFRLHPGKNVVEINAIDSKGSVYYASYVLLAGGQAPGDTTLPAGATMQSSPGPAAKSDPPRICLLEPTGPLRLTGRSGTVRVRGVVTGDAATVASVTVNGIRAALSPGSNSRSLVTTVHCSECAATAFESNVTVGPGATSLVIEARDREGSVTRLVIPVHRPEDVVSPHFLGRKLAILIGVSKYRYHERGLSDLDYADADARAFRDYLLQPESGKFAPSDILFMENDRATLSAVRASLHRLADMAHPDDLVLLFIACHGSPDPYSPQNLYFLMNDTKVADMENTALAMSEVRDILDKQIRSDHIVAFVDSCHSAGLSGDGLVRARQLENNLSNLYTSNLFKEKGRAVLTSSDVNEVSEESQHWGGGHGIFTLALLEGLHGQADLNRDGFVTAGELFAYVSDRVRLETGFHQNPMALPGLNRDLTLSLVHAK
jgi:hypothetical protein